MASVLVAGHVCVDFAPAIANAEVPTAGRLVPAGPLAISMGGCVGNTGLALARLGVDVALHAAIGDDALGDVVASMLSDAVGPERVVLERVADAATSYSIVIDPPGGDRSFWHHVGANARYVGPARFEADVVHLGYPTALSALAAADGARLRRLLEDATMSGAVTSLDLSSTVGDTGIDWRSVLTGILPFVDVASPSIQDLRPLVPELAAADAGGCAAWLVEHGVAVAMVTDGPRGAVIRFGSRRRLDAAGDLVAMRRPPAGEEIAAAPHVVRGGRTTGAGDVATAGLIAAIVSCAPPAEWCRMAVETAAAHVARTPARGHP